MRYYVPKHFSMREYVPPSIYDLLGEGAVILFDDRLLRSDDAIREYFGVSITINNWHSGGNRMFSGYRPPLCETGSQWSQHRFGRASDKLLNGITAEIARKEIIKNRKAFPFITAMEAGVSWLHTDTRGSAADKIALFNP